MIWFDSEIWFNLRGVGSFISKIFGIDLIQLVTTGIFLAKEDLKKLLFASLCTPTAYSKNLSKKHNQLEEVTQPENNNHYGKFLNLTNMNEVKFIFLKEKHWNWKLLFDLREAMLELCKLDFNFNFFDEKWLRNRTMIDVIIRNNPKGGKFVIQAIRLENNIQYGTTIWKWQIKSRVRLYWKQSKMKDG
jgi:hypothetical protein